MRKRANIGMIIVAMVSFACQKEQPTMSELGENCDCAHEVTADFYMEELATPIDWHLQRKSTDTDTIYANKNVWFHPKETNAEYTWYIGAETLTEEEVYRHFGEEHVGQTYTISLAVKKKPNRICFPNDDGVDSVARKITIVEPFDDYTFFTEESVHRRFEGDYIMKDSMMADSIPIHINITDHIDGTVLNDQFVIYGHHFYEDLDSVNFGDDDANYRQFWLSGNFCFGGDAGIHVYKRLDSVCELKLRANTGSNCSSYHFYGRKLNN